MLFDLSEEPIEMVEVRHVSLNRGKADAPVAAGDKRNFSIELTELFLVSCHFPVWVGFD